MIWTIFLTISIIFGICIGFIFAKLFAKRSRLSVSQTTVEENVNALFASAQSQREIILNEALKATQEQYAAEAIRLNNSRSSLMKLNENSDLELNEKQSEVDKFENNLLENEEKLKDKETTRK